MIIIFINSAISFFIMVIFAILVYKAVIAAGAPKKSADYASLAAIYLAMIIYSVSF